MFNTIKLLEREAIDGARWRAMYAIKDTCFEDNIVLEFGRQFAMETGEPLAILSVYKDRKYNMARNLALYYFGMGKQAPRYMHIDKEFIDREQPSFNYGKNIYRLVEFYYKNMKEFINTNCKADSSAITNHP